MWSFEATEISYLLQSSKISLVKLKKKNTDLFHCLCEFFRFKVQKRKTDRKTLHSHLLQYYFPVNVTLKLHYFRITSFPIRDDSETSCQLSFNITKLFYFGTPHSITCFIPVCLQIQITSCVELPSLEMTCFPLLYVNTFLLNCCFHLLSSNSVCHYTRD